MKYAGMRAASNVLLRDVNTSLIIEEMYRGANVIYADFTDYDELAHHCGPERVESFEALDGVDAAIGTLANAAEDAPRPYKFIILSDHGQSLGATFKQRYGESLGEVVRDLMSGRATLVQAKTAGEGSTFVNSMLSEITRSKGIGPTITRAALADQTTRRHRQPRRGGDPAAGRRVDDRRRGLRQPRARVVHRPRPPADARGARGRSTPSLVAALAGASRRRPPDGPLVGARRRRLRCPWRPLPRRGPWSRARIRAAIFGPHTVMSLKREDAMTHAPDLLLLSQYDPEMGEVAAFEELIGSHGGLGGFQTQPFILHPKEWELDEPVPLGAPAIYRNLRRWLSSMGIELGKPSPVAASATPAEPAPEVVGVT